MTGQNQQEGNKGVFTIAFERGFLFHFLQKLQLPQCCWLVGAQFSFALFYT